MPYADPIKRAEAANIRAKNSQKRKKIAKLQGEIQDPAVVLAAKEAAGLTPRSDYSDSPKPASAAVSPAGLAPVAIPQIPTVLDFARQKVTMGLLWIEQSKNLLQTNPTAAFQIGRAGVDLVNANLALLPEFREDGAKPGSVAVVDEEILRKDPEYRRLAEAMLIRKMELQLASPPGE